MNKSILLFCLISCLSTSIFSQSFLDKFGAGINFDIKSPHGTLKENGLTNFYGLSMEVFYVGCSEKKFRFTPGYRIGGGITKSIWGDNVILADPAGAEATQRLFNAFLQLELIGRFIYDNGNRIRPYGEVYVGFRTVGAYENYSLIEPIEGYSNSSDHIFSNVSTSAGIGFGALFQLSDAIDLNVRVANEYTDQIDHSNLRQDNFFSTEKIRSNNTYNTSFSIGIFFRPLCGRKKCNKSVNRSNRFNSGHINNRRQSKPVRRSIKT
ncbi:hypothetical protein N9L92_04190 [Saprospiraceae bacterium]|nr:hypothetical protein [Saprospiraceae bacterium]